MTRQNNQEGGCIYLGRKGAKVGILRMVLALNGVLSCAYAASPKITFDIPAETLTQAIADFRRQSGLDASFVSSDSRGSDAVQTRAVVGKFDIFDTWTRMLDGTGMTFRFAKDGTVLIEAVKAAPAASPSGQGMGPVPVRYEEAPLVLEVTVTGSLIRGVDAITAPMVVVDEKEKGQAPYASVQDVLRTLPLSFGGTTGEDYSLNQNYSRGAAINLRGLGTGATLILVDGQRQPESGIKGDFVDVSPIPWSAVDHIDILTDGASALYGSDAIAGVVNIIMRDNLSGVAETETRFGTTSAGASEKLLSQSFGHRWSGGKLLLTYQFSQRDSLAADERTYSASADKRPLGGSDLRSIDSNPGNILNPVTQQPVFAIPAGQNGRSLKPSELLPGVTNFYDQMVGSDILPDKEMHSLFFKVSQDIGEHVTLFTEGRYNHTRMTMTDPSFGMLLAVPSTNPFLVDPFGGSSFVLVGYNFGNEFGHLSELSETSTYTGTLGVKTKIGSHWQATVSGYYGEETMDWRGYNLVDPTAIERALADSNPATAFNPFGAGSNTNPATLNSMRLTQIEQSASHVNMLNLTTDGPLFELSTGTSRLAVGIDWREETLFRHEVLGRDFMTSTDYGREVMATFGELSLPLPLHLNLSLAGRYESYSDFGKTLNPKIGLRWSVNPSLRIRGSWSTSFRAPTLVDLYDHSNDAAALLPVTNQHSPTGHSMVLFEQGSNSSLRKETATNWTGGIDWASSSISDLTLSSTYYAINYGDRIFYYSPTLSLETMLADATWSPLITRNPSRAQVSSICNSPIYYGSSSDCLKASPIAIIDTRLRNLSRTRVDGIDMDLKKMLRTDFGSYTLELNGSYMLSYKEAVTSTAPSIDVVGTILNPPRLRLRGTTEWSRRGINQPGWSASLSGNYISAFRDDSSDATKRISALATLDLQLNYRTARSDAWFGNLKTTLNLVNAFNQNPPFANLAQGYDPANAKPYGRVVNLTVRKDW